MSTRKGPRNATTDKRSGQRFYTWTAADGTQERFWSVTTILQAVPKPALLPWGIKMVATGAVEAVQSGALVPMVAQDAEAAVQFLKGLPYANRQRAADLGSDVHAAIEAYILGRPMPAWPEPIRAHMLQFERFLADYRPEYEASEATVYSRSQAFAGTLDAIATVCGRKLLIDVKSGKDFYSEVALQLAMYRAAEFIGAPDGTEIPMPETDGGACLHITPEGYRLVEVDTGPEVFRAALYVREVFRWTEEQSKKVIWDAVPLPEAVGA